MRVLGFIFATSLAVFAGFGSSAQASWKNSVFGASIAPPQTVRTRSKSKQPKSTTPYKVSKSKSSKTKSKPSPQRGRSLRGLASYYWQPQPVASGGRFNPNALTAAHKTLRFGTRVRVTNLRNGRSVVVRINDRGPYIKGRIIDLSLRAAGVVGMRKSGVVPVRVDIL